MNKKITTYMLGATLTVAVAFASCSKDTEIEYRDVIVHDTVRISDNSSTTPEDLPYTVSESGQINTEVSGAIIVNEKDVMIDYADPEKCNIIKRKVSVLKSVGWRRKWVIDCPIMSAFAIDPNDKEHVDTTKTVDNVTLINRGHIEIHTKNIVECYKEQLVDDDNENREFEYIRMMGLVASGKNCVLINDGVIDVYFDHDPSVTCTVYCFTMAGDYGSNIINNGTINFKGNGSSRTRMRGIGVTGSHATASNRGTMNMQVENAEDSRMITAGSDTTNILNDGIMIARQPGNTYGMTRYGTNNIVNNGYISITETPVPNGQSCVLADGSKFICGIYENENKNRFSVTPPAINRGTIEINIEDGCDKVYQGYGMMFHELSPEYDLSISIVNDGVIKTSQSGSVHHDMAEAGFITTDNSYTKPGVMYLGHWNTRLRDFSSTHDLFLAKGVEMHFGGGLISLTKPSDYVDGTKYSVAPEAIMYCVPNSGKYDYINTYKGYETIEFDTNEKEIEISWDTENQTVSLNKISI